MVSYCKICNVEDFRDDALAGAIASVYGASPRAGREDRKQWEVGMAVHALDGLGVLGDDAEVLGVGAGHEATTFSLTNRVRRVFATDLYLTPGSWERTATTEMLGQPERFWTGAWNPRRLVVQHMDALDLRYEDASFGGIFSSSSIEHFGDDDAVRRSASEMCRVLRPGGICSISTELKLRGVGVGLPGIRLFSAAELTSLLVDDLPWDLTSDLDLGISTHTTRVETNFADAASDVVAGRPEWSTYPHIVLHSEEYAWTSIHLALKKR